MVVVVVVVVVKVSICNSSLRTNEITIRSHCHSQLDLVVAALFSIQCVSYDFDQIKEFSFFLNF